MRLTARMQCCLVVILLVAPSAWGSPFVPAGDMVLRQDIQRLADAGVIKGPVTTWPLAWGPILTDLRQADVTSMSVGLAAALTRVTERADRDTRSHELTFDARAAVGENPTRIRGFSRTPRGEVEVSARTGWFGNWFSVDVDVQGVDSKQDAEELRVDGSHIGIVAGNWSIAASTQERWWGPGWDGSLILSSNARPFPSISIDRVFTDAFETKWLNWLGPWDLSVIFGQLEKDRYIPNAQFFGMRFGFRPLDSLEISLFRSALWCGDGRPCNFDTFVDLLLGKDNRGDAGINADNEPGNQLAGLDFRWSPGFFDRSIALYGQLVGEDEAGGFPSRYLGQFGAEWSGYLAERWSASAFVEFAGTSCQFHESSEIFNCAYNHTIYRTGYRYRSRVIGHGADNDARLISTGITLADTADTRWRGLLRHGVLNRGGAPDPNNSLTPTRQDVSSIDVSYTRRFTLGVIDIGAGYERIHDDVSAQSSSDTRFYVQWRSSY